MQTYTARYEAGRDACSSWSAGSISGIPVGYETRFNGHSWQAVTKDSDTGENFVLEDFNTQVDALIWLARIEIP